MRNIAIVGAGVVGKTLGRVLARKRGKIVCVVSRTLSSARAGGRFLRCRNFSTSLRAIPPDTDLVFITTPHAAVQEVALALAGCDSLAFRRLSVCHASGMLPSDVLEPVRGLGATVFSFHPLQTFPRDFDPADLVKSVRGIYYGVDGDPRGVRSAAALARQLGGKILRIPPEMRPFYHAACVIASNHLTTMLWVLEEMFRRLGSSEKNFFPVFRPILAATLQNVALTSPARALSGPIARGGVGTLADHLQAMRVHAPEFMPYFSRMSMETVRLADRKGSLRAEAREAMTALLLPYLARPSLAKETS